MAVEKIDKNLNDIVIDPDMEIRTVQYLYRELVAGNIAGVISQPQIVRYFEERNPELVVKKVYSFKNDPQALTVTIKMQVTKRTPIKSYAAVDGVDQNTACTEPITNPARLLNAGQDITDLVRGVADDKDARIAELEKEIDELIREAVSAGIPGALRIVELEKQLEQEKLANKIVRQEMNNFQTERDEAEKENASLRTVGDRKNKRIDELVDRAVELERGNIILKSAIEKFGNGQDFDWDVLAEIENLREENAELKAQIEMTGEQNGD